MKNKIVIIIFILFNTASCLKNEIPADYYEDTNKIKGGEKPEAVTLFEFDFTDQKMDWSDSTDPDVGETVTQYYIFCYSEYIPENIYDERYILFSVDGNSEANLSNYDIADGNYYFMVTAFDGDRISEKSNFINIHIDSSYEPKSSYYGTITDYEDSTARCLIKN